MSVACPGLTLSDKGHPFKLWVALQVLPPQVHAGLSGVLAGHQHLTKLSFAGSSLGDDNLKVKPPYDERQQLPTPAVQSCFPELAMPA